MAPTRITVHEGIGELILNRPEQRNSLTGPLVQGLQAGLESLLDNADCRVILIRGEGGYFCAGLDLKAFSADPAPEWRASFQDDWARFHRTLYESDKPVIGALERFAIAGGSALALACDFLVVGKSAFMHVSEVERNMLAPLNVFWLTARHSYHQALKFAVLGERHSGEVLVQFGLAECCVDDERVLECAREMATRLSGFDPGNVMALKKSVQNGAGLRDFDQVLERIKSGDPLRA